MKLLTRLGVGRSGGLINFIINRERPLFQQGRPSSIHVVPTPSRRHRHMVTTATCRRKRESSGPAPALAADDTRWMILNRWCCATDSTAVDVVAGAKAVAETHTSRGPLRVSLSRAAPPSISFLCFDWAGYRPRSEGKSPDDGFSHAVVAAHGDSILLRFGGDYFVYKVAAGQPPSLTLLPACRHVPMYEWDSERGELYDYDSDPGEVDRTERELDQMDTALLRCGGDGGGGEFLVAQLQVAYKAPFDTAELCVLRPGRRDWEFREAVPIVHNEGGGRHDLGRCQAVNAAVPSGDRFLCWVSYDHSTLLVCDMTLLLWRHREQEEPVRALRLCVHGDHVDAGAEDDDDDGGRGRADGVGEGRRA